MLRTLSALLLLLVSAPGHAGQFGEFEGRPQGEFLPGPDRPLFKLHAPFVYHDPNGLDWTAPANEVIDGATIPWPAWSIVGGPFSGNYLNAAVIHDYYCCTKSREYYSTHHTFWLGMRAAGIGSVKADIMWAAVRVMGPEKWSVDPSAIPPVPCNTETIAVGNIFDPASPETKSKAVAKLTAMARTLATTDGVALDVVEGHVIETETPEADAHLAFLQEALLKGFDVQASKVGLVSGITEFEMTQVNRNERPVATWIQGQIPALDTFMEARKLAYPPPATIDGEVYVPLAVDLLKFQTNQFPVEPLEKRFEQLRRQ